MRLILSELGVRGKDVYHSPRIRAAPLFIGTSRLYLYNQIEKLMEVPTLTYEDRVSLVTWNVYDGLKIRLYYTLEEIPF